MWVAAVLATGPAPEVEAFQRLRQWAAPKGLFAEPERHPVFGFNNPSPSPGKPEYGYELWLRVDAPDPSETAVVFKLFEGGLFAVTACALCGEPGIMETWRLLWEWAQTGPYRWRRAQELEKVLNPEAPEDRLMLELYLPVDLQQAA